MFIRFLIAFHLKLLSSEVESLITLIDNSSEIESPPQKFYKTKVEILSMKLSGCF